MKTDPILQDIIQQCRRLQLKLALETLANYLLTHQQPAARQQLEQLQITYDMLLQTWQKGLPDNRRADIYHDLLTDCYQLAASLLTDVRIDATYVLQDMRGKVVARRGQQWSAGDMQAALEDFVARRGMLDLEQPHVRSAHEEELYQQHGILMNDIFNSFVTRKPSRRQVSDIETMLLSDVIDVVDRQLIVSAITLSLLCCFDFPLWSALVSLCMKCSDESLRQRALVGIILTADERMLQLFPQINQRLDELQQALPDLSEQVTELQIQMMFCLQAEEDTRTMRDELMPEMMRNSQMRITPMGIEENDDDNTDDMLHPERADKRMERMEQAIGRMSEMMKQGSDIYFGGFAETKRMPFFSAMSNWLVPFYQHHPAIYRQLKETRSRHFLINIIQSGSFCDSDKYSFVLLFQKILSSIPENMIQALEGGQATLMGELGEHLPVGTPAYQRRTYLQDLYRFFRLHPQRDEFVSPFADGRYLFLSSAITSRLVSEEQCCQVASSLIHHRRSCDALHLLMSRKGQSLQYHLLCARLAKLPEAAKYQLSQELCYDRALDIDHDHPKALAGKARCLFHREAYEQAAALYLHLSELQPKKLSYSLNAAACQANMGSYEEALKTLFRLDYEHPDNQDVTRVLAWTLMAAGRYDEALTRYDRLPQEPADQQNRAYCLWMSERVDEAASLIRQTALPIDASDEKMLLSGGITHTEIALMRENYCSA